MQIRDDDGGALDTDVDLEVQGDQAFIMYKARGGKKGTPDARNTDYSAGLELLLKRLGGIRATLADAHVDSKDTAQLDERERRVHVDGFDYPIRLQLVQDFDVLRKSISKGQARVGRAPGAKGRGNGTKTIRMSILLKTPMDARSLLNQLTSSGDPFEAQGFQERLADNDETERARSGGQGFSSDPRFTKVVEQWAMERAKEHFAGWGVTDTSRGHPYDLLYKRGKTTRYIEVKGTTGDGAAVTVTFNEVEHARVHRDDCVLFLVHSIKVGVSGGELVGSGGEVIIVEPWRPQEAGTLKPIGYRYTLPAPG